MKILYVHIGTPKTGTSTLQHFLIKNRNQLEQKGVFYPIWNGPQTAGGGEDAVDGNFGWITRNSIVCEEKKSRMLSLFEKHDVVLLSTENIWLEVQDKGEFFNKLKNYYTDVTIKVIVYLRKQVDYLESQYRECIRVGNHTISVKECLDSDNNVIKFIREKGCNYYQELASIAQVVGKENLLVRPYEKIQFKNGNLIDDFLSLLAINEEDGFILTSNYNFSMSNRTLELKRLMNAVDTCESKKMNELFYDILMKNDFKNIGVDGKVAHFKSQLKEIDRDEFMKKFEKENRNIAIEYLDKENECLFEEEATECEEVSTEELLEQSIRTFTAINIQLHEQFESENFKLREALLKLEKEIISINLEVKEEISKLDDKHRHELETLE